MKRSSIQGSKTPRPGIGRKLQQAIDRNARAAAELTRVLNEVRRGSEGGGTARQKKD